MSQCFGCKFYDDNTDESVGMYGQPSCSAFDEIQASIPNEQYDALARFSEKICTTFEVLAFRLSELNNCPFRQEEPRRLRRNILEVAP